MGLSTVVGLGGCVAGGEGEAEGLGLGAGAAFSAAFIAAHSALPTLGALAAGGDVRPTPLAALPPRDNDWAPFGCGLVGVLVEGDESDDEDTRERPLASGAGLDVRPGAVEIVFARPRPRPPPRPRVLRGAELGICGRRASLGMPFGSAEEVDAPATAVIAAVTVSDSEAEQSHAP